MRTHWRERRLHTFASPSDVLSTVRSSSDRQTERTSWRWPSPTSAAVSTAALTVYDMVKAVDKGMVIGGIRVMLKDGGKSGRYEVK